MHNRLLVVLVKNAVDALCRRWNTLVLQLFLAEPIIKDFYGGSQRFRPDRPQIWLNMVPDLPSLYSGPPNTRISYRTG